jgi:hypothetical protein
MYITAIYMLGKRHCTLGLCGSHAWGPFRLSKMPRRNAALLHELRGEVTKSIGLSGGQSLWKSAGWANSNGRLLSTRSSVQLRLKTGLQLAALLTAGPKSAVKDCPE